MPDPIRLAVALLVVGTLSACGGSESSGGGSDDAPDAGALEQLEATAAGLPSCRLFTPTDFFAMFGSLPTEITTSGNSGLACQYRAGGIGIPELSIGEVCADPRNPPPKSGPASKTMTPIQRFKDQYPERTSAGPQGTKTNEFGSLGVIRGDCVVSVSATELEDVQMGAILEIAAERAE